MAATQTAVEALRENNDKLQADLRDADRATQELSLKKVSLETQVEAVKSTLLTTETTLAELKSAHAELQAELNAAHKEAKESATEIFGWIALLKAAFQKSSRLKRQALREAPRKKASIEAAHAAAVLQERGAKYQIFGRHR